MKFTKYQKFGAYHWKQYNDKNTKYSRHADRVKEWVNEKNVLDIGAGDGLITYLLGAKGVDNEPEAVKLAQEKGGNVIWGNANLLRFEDEEFEAVFMGDVLEHLEFPRQALKEARRVLKSYLYLVTPEKGTNNDKFHYEEWTPEELKKLVESEGFVLEGEMLEVPKDKRIYGKFKKKDINSTENKESRIFKEFSKNLTSDGVKMGLRKEYTTHIPMLIKTVQMTDGPVLELGAGLFSTPLLHWLCLGRDLFTYETNPDYYNFAKKFRTNNHRTRLVDDWDKIDIDNTHWSVVFVDHGPVGRRVIDLIRLKDKADYIVIHDTEPGREHRHEYNKAWPLFKYRYDWTKCIAHTTVVSNFKDLSNLE